MNPALILGLPRGIGQKIIRQWIDSLISNLGGPNVFAIVCCIPLSVFTVVCIAKFVFWLIHRHKSRKNVETDGSDESAYATKRDKKHSKRKKQRKHLREESHDRTGKGLN